MISTESFQKTMLKAQSYHIGTIGKVELMADHFQDKKAAPCNAIVLIEFPCLRNRVAKLLLSARKLPIRTVSITRNFPYNLDHAVHVREQLLNTSVWTAHAAYLGTKFPSNSQVNR